MRLLYKYCSIERVEQILRTHTIRISDATKLNDPFEYAYSLGQGFPLDLTEFDRLSLKLEYIIPRLRQFGIYSLSESNDSILMWSHYAFQHEGVCIEYDVDNDTELFDMLEPVEYCKNYPVILKRGDRFDILDVLTTKHEQWQYEKEVRLIKEGKTGNDLPIKPRAIRSIILGNNISHFYGSGSTKIDKQRLKYWKSLIEHLKLPQNEHIKIKQVQCDDMEYKIHFAEVPFIILQDKRDELLIISLKRQNLKMSTGSKTIPIQEYTLSKWQELRLQLPEGVYYLSNGQDNLFSLEIEHQTNSNYLCKRFLEWSKKVLSGVTCFIFRK